MDTYENVLVGDLISTASSENKYDFYCECGASD